MPEAAEVRLTADWLRREAVGCVLRDVTQAGRFVKRPIANLERTSNRTILDVRCRGKVVVLDLSDDVSAVSTLGMSGRWTRQETAHVALTLWCEKPPTRGMLPIHFVDQRHFGDFRVVTRAQATSRLDELGWDPLAEAAATGKGTQLARLVEERRRSPRPVCELMLDQAVFAGCGNYLRAEAMYRARVDPWKSWLDLSNAQQVDLCRALRDVCAEAYAAGGTTLATFYDGDGKRGDHVDRLAVYGRGTDPEGRQVSRRKDRQGRTVWWCPEIQGV